MDDLVRLTRVSKAYRGVFAVSDVDLSVARGERLAVIGPNGAGKSTLFGLIAGEHRPTSGQVCFDGADVTRWIPSRRAAAGIRRTFQVARLFGSMSVQDNMLIAAIAARQQRQPLRGLRSRQEIRRTVDDVLERTSLAGEATRMAGTLAQGSRKTLEIAMAIVQDPLLLLLDEPTAGMSYEDGRRATELIRRLADEHPEITIVLTAHDMDFVFAVAERVMLLVRGATELDGTPQQVSEHPKTRDVYLGQQFVGRSAEGGASE